jgi:adenylate kinase
MTERSPGTFQAVLLLGPTGAGKTPLGDWLETHGLWGRRCHHFDFGACLRTTVAAGPDERFDRREIEFLQSVLAEGVLLENDSFHLAEKILDAFIARRAVQPGAWIVMNGLPRHVGQAQALERRLEVCAVIQLECEARVIRERLRRDTGGDRAVRTDDTDELVARKLAIYAERTRPLVSHFRQRGARLIGLEVGIETQPAELAERVEMLGGKSA